MGLKEVMKHMQQNQYMFLVKTTELRLANIMDNDFELFSRTSSPMPVALITGANRGLGLEFTRQYLADGWQVFANCEIPPPPTSYNAWPKRRAASSQILASEPVVKSKSSGRMQVVNS
jgi:hypothetical protein